MLKNLRTFNIFTKNAQKHTLNRQTQLKTYKDTKNKIKLIFTHFFARYEPFSKYYLIKLKFSSFFFFIISISMKKKLKNSLI